MATTDLPRNTKYWRVLAFETSAKEEIIVKRYISQLACPVTNTALVDKELGETRG